MGSAAERREHGCYDGKDIRQGSAGGGESRSLYLFSIKRRWPNGAEIKACHGDKRGGRQGRKARLMKTAG